MNKTYCDICHTFDYGDLRIYAGMYLCHTCYREALNHEQEVSDYELPEEEDY